MNPIVKLHLGSAAYCAVLLSLNWSRSIEYSRTSGLTSEGFSGGPISVILSGAFVVVLAWHCFRSARRALEVGSRVADGRWILTWSVACYALPLVPRSTGTSNWTEPDGAFATATGGYGHEMSLLVFILAVAGMYLFQILMRLTAVDKAAEPGATDNPDDAQRLREGH